MDPDRVEARLTSMFSRALGVTALLVLALTGVSCGVSQQDDPRDGERAVARDAAAMPRSGEQLRQVTWRGVAVEVPVEWGDATAPTGAWCAYDQGPGKPPFPTEPYVALDTSFMVIPAIGCIGDGNGAPAAFDDVPVRYWAPHVWFELAEQAAGGEGTSTYRDWTLSSRTVGDVRVNVLADEATVDAMEDVLASAQQVRTGDDGCDATSPVQAFRFVRPDSAFDVTTVKSVDSISVCEYDRSAGTARPGLLGSRVLDGTEAADVLAAIQSAPAGGGPDAPEHCLGTMYGETAIALRLHDGETTHDLYVYYDWCFGNGFDDGTTQRELTRGSCQPLWGGRVQLWGGSSEPFSRCHD
jgi:hypothetical protein